MTESMTVLSSTPFSSPIFKNNVWCTNSSPPISTTCILVLLRTFQSVTLRTCTLSAAAGSACIDNGARQSLTSSDMIRTVLSSRPIASSLHVKRNNHKERKAKSHLARCSFAGTSAIDIHTTSLPKSRLSVYSLSWPVGSSSK